MKAQVLRAYEEKRDLRLSAPEQRAILVHGGKKTTYNDPPSFHDLEGLNDV